MAAVCHEEVAAEVSGMDERTRRLLYPRLRPFSKGQSGNPRGRPKGSRNRRSVKAEALGLILMRFQPDLASALATLGRGRGWRDRRAYLLRQFRRRSQPDGVRADASRLADLHLLAIRMLLDMPSAPVGYECAKCRLRFWNDDPIIVPMGLGALAFHDRCIVPFFRERQAQSRAELLKTLEKPRRAPRPPLPGGWITESRSSRKRR